MLQCMLNIASKHNLNGMENITMVTIPYLWDDFKQRLMTSVTKPTSQGMRKVCAWHFETKREVLAINVV